jgi:hypothetical protein
MAKHQHVAQRNESNVMDAAIESTQQDKVSIEDMPLETLRDYRVYNEEARRLNKKLRMNRYPIKQCPVELHPKQRIKFGNNDRSIHPVKVLLSNHLIHFEQKLYPGKEYDLPECVVHYLSEKGYPVWGYVTLADGSRETQKIGMRSRFSVTTVFRES